MNTIRNRIAVFKTLVVFAVVALTGLQASAQTVTLIGAGVRNGDFNDDSSATDERSYSETAYWVNLGGGGDAATATRTNTDFDGTRNHSIGETSWQQAAQDTGYTMVEGDVVDVRYVWRDASSWDDASDRVVVKLFTTATDLIDGARTVFATLPSGTSRSNSSYERGSGRATITSGQAGKRLFVAIDTLDGNGAANGFARLDDFVLTVARAVDVYFNCHFDATPLIDYGDTNFGGGGYAAPVTESNLNAGTAIGSWTTNVHWTPPDVNSTRSIQGADCAPDPVNKALRFGIGLDAVNTTLLTANLAQALSLENPTTFSFDTYLGIANTSFDRPVYVSGVDSSDREVFKLEFQVGSDRLAYRDTSDLRQLLGTASNLLKRTASSSPKNAGSDYDPAKTRTVGVVVHDGTFEVLLDGGTLDMGIPFKDSNADGLAKLLFGVDGSKWTGIFVDNMLVTQVIPPPAGTVLTIR